MKVSQPLVHASETAEVDHGESCHEIRSEAVWLLKLLSCHRASDIVESVNDLFTEKLAELVRKIEAAHRNATAITNLSTQLRCVSNLAFCIDSTDGATNDPCIRCAVCLRRAELLVLD